MSPVLFIAMPFILLLLMSQGAGASKTVTDKDSKDAKPQDDQIIIIRKQ